MAIALRGLHPEVRERAEIALEWAEHFGIPVRVTSTFRTWTDQLELRNRWLAGKSRFPANAPGDSSHNYGLSWDSVVSPQHQDLWNRIRQFVGFAVPGNDLIHAEVPGWRRFVFG